MNPPLRRRRVLQLAGLAAGATVTGIGLTGCGEQAGESMTSDLPLPEPFTVALPVPTVAVPDATDDGVDHYTVTQRAADIEILPGVTTRVWGFDGRFPGPTFRARRGRPVTITVVNTLPVPTSTHLHGGVTPSESDGLPTDLVVPDGLDFTPGAGAHMTVPAETWRLHPVRRDYTYPNEQRAATLWYHDHRMDFTAPQVWRGLAGMYLLGDDEEDSLGLPTGDRDIPLFVCDRAFTADGDFKYPARDDTLLSEPGTTGDYHRGVEGDIILVNGAPWPRMEVVGGRYRFRVLNAANARRFALSLDPPPAHGPAFVQVGTDQGLLAAPVERDELTISPGERYDLLVDFSRYRPGSTVTLQNALGNDRTAAVMRFVVGRTEPVEDLPSILADQETLSPEQSVGDRVFRFERSSVGVHHYMWTINGEPYDAAGSIATVGLDTVEKWTFTSDFHHPVHVHLGHFQVLTRNGKPADDLEAGWKDTVDLRPLEVVEVLVRFSQHKGRYMMHCHNLEHEDMAMMANFDVA